MNVTIECVNAIHFTKLNKCKEAGQHIRNVCIRIQELDITSWFLEDLAHAVSCMRLNCTNICEFFKILRVHTRFSNHKCEVSYYYKFLLRTHVMHCANNECNLIRCRQLATVLQGRDAKYA